jgi:orotate phosphoribosyltransferase
MSDTPGQRDVIRERLLALLAERPYHYRPEKPFTLASGATSPFYLDARVTTWDPEAKPPIGALVFDLITGKADAVGGLTLGANPIAGAYYRQLAGAPIRAFTRIRSGVCGVPCTVIFTRADLDDRVQRGRNAAPPT